MSHVPLIQSLYDAFARADIPKLLQSFDPQVSWSEAENNPYQPSGQPWIGPAAILENLFVRIGSDWDRFDVEIRRIHDAGSTVVAEVRYRGTFLATRRTMDAQALHIWELRGDKVIRFQQYADTAQLQAVMVQ